MRRARLTLHGSLSELVPEARRHGSFEVQFELPVGLRDLVQSTGVPHVEVARVTVDGRSAAWHQVVDDACSIEAHPLYPLAEPPEDPRFVLDVHLGKLASHMRLVGLDARYAPAPDDASLIRLSNSAGRTVLTRDRGLLMHGSLERGYFVRSTNPLGQAIEVVDRFALNEVVKPFSRCMVCNERLATASPEAVAERVPAAVAQRHREFRACPGCGRVYWQGSHHQRLERLVEAITKLPQAHGAG
jgi:uncharacterized protein with PIN domain